MILTLKLMALAALFVGTGGVLYPDRFKNHKPILLLTALVGILGTTYLFRDLYEDILSEAKTEISRETRIDISAVPRLDANSLGNNNVNLYIDSDESYETLKNFLNINTSKIVFLSFWFQNEYIKNSITKNMFGNDASQQIRYGICPAGNSDVLLCDVLIVTNHEIFRSFLDKGISGSIGIDGYFYVEPQKAPKNYLDIPYDGMLTKRFLRAVDPF